MTVALSQKRIAVMRDLLAALFILLFVYTGFNKMLGWHQFTAVLRSSPLLQSFAPAVAWLVILAELLVSILLFLPAMRSRGFAGAVLLMGVFTGYIGYMLITQEKLPCSCGGVLSQLKWSEHFMLNGILTTLAAIGFYIENKSQLFIAINRES